MITVVGCGTGPIGERAAALLAGAELVVGAARHLEEVRIPAGARRLVLGPLAPALEAIAACPGEVAVLASGDPGFFGIVRALADRFGPDALDVHPAPSSVAAAFARLSLPWDDAVVVSAHGRDLRTAANVCRARRKVAVLTAPGAGPAELAGELLATPGIERRLVVAADLGGRAERIEWTDPEHAARREWPAVNLVLCLGPGAEEPGPMRTVAGAVPGPQGWALPETAFAHRDSMITKAEVRALALARLGPRLGELVWDVGAGSGSVAVECARLGAAVVAVERARDGAALVRANAAAHGVDVAVVCGAAPQALAALPDPDAVFVGGGGADLPAIVAACAERARRTVVVTLAALDRVPAVLGALQAAGFAADGTLLQSSRLAPLPGDVSRLAAGNPVFVLWADRAGAVPAAGPHAGPPPGGPQPGGPRPGSPRPAGGRPSDAPRGGRNDGPLRQTPGQGPPPGTPSGRKHPEESAPPPGGDRDRADRDRADRDRADRPAPRASGGASARPHAVRADHPPGRTQPVSPPPDAPTTPRPPGARP